MNRKFIQLANTPKIPLSSGVRAGDFIFVSGQVGYEDPKTGREVKSIEAQAAQCLENVKTVLEAAGSAMTDVVKVNIYLKNATDFEKMNEVYRRYFTQDLPARCTVVPALTQPKMLIEIECIAYSP
jgi:2-iminobutanoate/2-iminopropanoate deaminase